MGNSGKALSLSAAAAIWFGGSVAIAGECHEEQVLLRGDWGQARFTVEVADDKSERAKGLMFRKSMPQSAGMLFVYPSPKTVGFWMKNTLIPLDMIFMDETGTVRRVHHNAIPHDETPIMGGADIKLVLEINAGMAKTLGIVEGSQMQHPALAVDKAAWPC